MNPSIAHERMAKHTPYGCGAMSAELVERQPSFVCGLTIHLFAVPHGALPYQSVFRNAISAFLSADGSFKPNSCPGTARVFTPYPAKPVGT